MQHILRDAPWLRSLHDSGCAVRMLVHRRFAEVAIEAGVPRSALLLVREDDIAAALPDPQINVNRLFHRHYPSLTGMALPGDRAEDADWAANLCDRLAAAMNPAIGDFEPDVIVTWVPAPHLRQLFPDALILHKETAMYARSPYPTSCSLDPQGFHRWSCARRGGSTRPTPGGRAAFGRLKGRFDRGMEAIDRWFAFDSFRSAYAGTIFVPSQMSGGFLFDGACPYRSQTNMILDVLERAPADWAVIVNDHPDCPALNDWERRFIAGRHSNFHYRLNAFYGEGQQIVRRADVVATVSSSLGLQALMWDKALVALGDSHIPAFTPLRARDLPNVTRAAVKGHDPAAWLTFHYSYQNGMAGAPGWLASHLSDRWDHWRRHGAEGYFDEPWEDPDTIADFIADRFDDDLKRRLGDGSSAAGRSIPLERNEPFGRGWSDAETGPDGTTRWIDGQTADLTIHADPERDHVVTMVIGILAELMEQEVAVHREGAVIATTAIRAGEPARLTIHIPALRQEGTLIRLRLCMTRTIRPPWETRDLSLIVGSIDITAVEPPEAPGPARDGEMAEAPAEHEAAASP